LNIELTYKEVQYTADLANPIDISIPLKSGPETVNAFSAPRMKIVPIVSGDFIGDTKEGGSVNSKIITLNPHGNGTHTECVGHISKEDFFLNNCLQQFSFVARLITVQPETLENGDTIIRTRHLEDCDLSAISALIIRTLPNESEKLTRNYSGSNPTYFSTDALRYIVELGVEHLLIDLPSVDREEDGGALEGHHIFWKYPSETREQATITELIFVPNEILDGVYLLHHQVSSIESDASPSKPVLYALNSHTE